MKKSISGDNVNVAKVTRELLDLIMKLPGTERAKLLKELKPDAPIETGSNAVSNTTTALIEAVMKLNLQERCRILGEMKALSGSSKRKYSRVDFFSPIQFVINDRLSSGFIKNISISGIFIEAPQYSSEEVKPGMAVKMIFDHPHTGNHLKIEGKIIRVAKSGIGIRFDEKL